MTNANAKTAEAHLTDEQFSAAMLGEPMDAETLAHVAMCTSCQEEIAGFGAAVGDLALASCVWSERHSSAMPEVRVKADRTRAGLLQAYAWAAAGVLALAVTVPIAEHARHAASPATTAAGESEEAAGADSPEQIARDNQLLAEVHFELTRTDLPGAVRQDGRAGAMRRQP